MRQPALTDRYRVLNYHRRGFAGSTAGSEPASIADHAADALALMRHVGFERAHVVGHSLGGAIALQLALDAPEAVRSLVLLEPALMGAIARVQAAARPEAAASQRAFMANMEEVCSCWTVRLLYMLKLSKQKRAQTLPRLVPMARRRASRR